MQNEANKFHAQDEWLHRHKPEVYWPMLQTAEYVSKKYGIARELQDRYGARSQQRAAKAREEGKFRDEIVPITTKMKVVTKTTSVETEGGHGPSNEGIRPIQYEGVSQISRHRGAARDRGGQCQPVPMEHPPLMVMSDRRATKRGLKPLGIFRGFAVARPRANELGLAPVLFAVPRSAARAASRCPTSTCGN